MEKKTESIRISEATDILRRQKHDFVNHIQVLHAYLQVGKPDKAAIYLEELVHKINEGTFCEEYIRALAEKQE